VSVFGGEVPQVKENVSTKVVVLAGIGVVQLTGTCAPAIAPGVPLQTSQPEAPEGSVGRVTVTVWLPLVVFTEQGGPTSVIPANGENEIGERSVATMKYCNPVVTGTDPPEETTHDAGAAGVGIR